MQTIKGDLVKLAQSGQFDVIAHGCNCFNTMGAGIAKAIAEAFPEALAVDRATVKGDKSKLGTISAAEVQCGDHRIVVVNAYTQFNWRGRGRKVDYDAISTCFAEIAQQFPKARIGYPLIGAGLAGGHWKEIAPLIDHALDGLDHTLVVLPESRNP